MQDDLAVGQGFPSGCRGQLPQALAGSQSQVAIAWHLVCRLVERCWATQAVGVPDAHICSQMQALDTFNALYCRPGVVGLYKKLGFAADPEGIKGMVSCMSTPLLMPRLICGTVRSCLL